MSIDFKGGIGFTKYELEIGHRFLEKLAIHMTVRGDLDSISAAEFAYVCGSIAASTDAINNTVTYLCATGGPIMLKGYMEKNK